MSLDPTLTSDTAIFLESIAGDGGTHNPAAAWWLSPDVQLTGPSSGLDKADPDVDNTIKVTVHRKAGGTLPAGTGGVAVDVFVGAPSLAMTPNNAASTKLIQSAFIDIGDLAAGSTAVKSITWHPLSSTPGTAPDGPGHKCLIARCYPDVLTPTASSFFTPDEPHVGQHNITVVTAPAGGGGMRKFHMDVMTAQPGGVMSLGVQVKTVHVLNPDRAMLRVLTPRLREQEAFKQLITADGPLNSNALSRLRGVEGGIRVIPRDDGIDIQQIEQGFQNIRQRGLRFREMLNQDQVSLPRAFSVAAQNVRQHRVRDFIDAGDFVDAGGRLKKRDAWTKFLPEAEQVTTVSFDADLSDMRPGDAHIFNMTQTGVEGVVQGGLTVVVVAV